MSLHPHGHNHEHGAPQTAGSTIRWGSYYDFLTLLVLRGRAGGMRREVLKLAALKPGERVLDVGCGTGTLAIEAAAVVGATGRVVGIDAAPEMVDRARRKTSRGLSQVEFRTEVVERLPFEDGEFDAVLASLVLHHLPPETREAGVREIRRVLKPGGRLVVMEMGNPDALTRAIGHRMPADYMVRVGHGIMAAGFVDVRRAETRYKRYVFLRANVPS